MAYDPQNPKGHYDTDTKVPESVIEEIRQLGMEQAIKQARSGEASPEFVEGVRRFYPAAIEDIESSLGGEAQGPPAPGQAEVPRGDIADPPKIPTDDFATDGSVSNPPTSGGEFTPAPQVAPPGGGNALSRRLEGLGLPSSGGGESAPVGGNRQGSDRGSITPNGDPLQLDKVIGDFVKNRVGDTADLGDKMLDANQNAGNKLLEILGNAGGGIKDMYDRTRVRR